MINSRKILIVEDEESIRYPVTSLLNREGYLVTEACDGKEAISCLKAKAFDLIILDLMLPHLSGEEVLRYLSQSNIDSPTIIISAKITPEDRIAGLRLGAIDYVIKPFLFEELLLKVNRLIQRETVTNIFTFRNDVWVDLRQYLASNNNAETKLTQKEVAILKYFLNHKDVVISRDDIIAAAWNSETSPTLRTVDNFITKLRKIFEIDPKEPKIFLSVRGVGYMFSSESLLE